MTIGNHTQTHQDLSGLSASRIAWQIDTGRADIKRATGITPTWLRPPGGALSPAVYEQASKAGMRILLWDLDPNDWRRPPVATIVSRVVNGARSGDVVLLHDGGGDRSGTLAALPTIIKKLRAKGYRFETVDQLLGK
jgi:peptidoglycan/xylan/chitin deacetylase (PgdA/CDA1 family)